MNKELMVSAKSFVEELTRHNVVGNNLKGNVAVVKERVKNNAAVRKMLNERGGKPEALPAAEDVKKVQRRL
jgi:DNA-damage-inducible protein D